MPLWWQKPILRRATELARKHPLRACDAMHLAPALDLAAQASEFGLPAPVFISADDDLLTAARAEGLRTENPNERL